jgi:ribose transport system permease protein
MGQLLTARFARAALPGLSLATLLVAIFYLQPRAMSYVGLNLMLNLAVPIALATIAQMCVITVNDLDLSIGAYVGFVTCVAATLLQDTPLIGVAALAGGCADLCDRWRDGPSAQPAFDCRDARHVVCVARISVLILPTPGGTAPAWIRSLMTLKPPTYRFDHRAALIALVVHLALMRTSYGSILRGSGGNPKAIARAGWSL